MKQFVEDLKAGLLTVIKTADLWHINYLPDALNDVYFWKKAGNKSMLTKIQQLLNSIKTSPFEGIRKPEALIYHHAGK